MILVYLPTTAGIGLVAVGPVDPGGTPAVVGLLLNVAVAGAIALSLFLVVRAAILSVQHRKRQE